MNTLANSATNQSFLPNFVDQSDGLLSTVIWGTDGQGTIGGFSYSAYGSYIVTSASDSKRVEEIDIEQGDGFEAIVIILVKGVDLELEVIDDTAVNPPAIGNVVTFSTPFGSIPMLTVQSRANQARKREGMRTLNFKSFNAIVGLH